MSRSWCIAGCVNIVGSYGVFPSLSCCDELSFPFEISLLSDWILLWIRGHLIYVLHMNTCVDNGVLFWFTWYVFWHSTRGFPRWHWGNLCIGVDARFRPCFSGRNLGAVFEFLYVGLSIGFEDTWCMSCDGISVVIMGWPIDTLDVCFGTQLTDSRGDIGVIYA